MRFLSARAGIWALQPLKKHRNYCPFCVPALRGRNLAKCMKIRWIYENSWNFSKFDDFYWKSWYFVFSALLRPSRNLDIPKEKARVEQPGTPGSSQNRNLGKFSVISPNFMKFHEISLKFRNFKKNMFWGASERIWPLQPLKSIGMTCPFACRGHTYDFL